MVVGIRGDVVVGEEILKDPWSVVLVELSSREGGGSEEFSVSVR
jgi:hypothetical protein